VVAGEDGLEVEVLASRWRDHLLAGEEGALRRFSRRVIRRGCREPDSVVFLRRQPVDATLGATVDSWVPSVGACFIHDHSEGQPIVLYVLGDYAFATGEHWVAEFLRLIATLMKQVFIPSPRWP